MLSIIECIITSEGKDDFIIISFVTKNTLLRKKIILMKRIAIRR